MFDIGFYEILIIAVVALLVVGPERLPKIAYDAGLWFGRMQRYVRNARMEIERELHNYEIQQTLQQQTKELEEVKQLADSTVQEIKDELNELSQAEDGARAAIDEDAAQKDDSK